MSLHTCARMGSSDNSRDDAGGGRSDRGLDVSGSRLSSWWGGGRGQCLVLVRVTGVSVCTVPSRVHPVGGGEAGPRSVRQQRAARDGRVSARPFRGGEAPVPLATLSVCYPGSVSASAVASL